MADPSSHYPGGGEERDSGHDLVTFSISRHETSRQFVTTEQDLVTFVRTLYSEARDLQTVCDDCVNRLRVNHCDQFPARFVLVYQGSPRTSRQVPAC